MHDNAAAFFRWPEASGAAGGAMAEQVAAGREVK
jgi:hypothetical protein